MRTVILGWGSLLWEANAAFDAWHGAWASDGPKLPLEFSRVSSSRLGALTLVIDPENGELTVVSYAGSKRSDLEEAITDLRCREGTVLGNVGFVRKDGLGSRARDKNIGNSILDWLGTKADIDAVIWTDLESNFGSKCGANFSVDNAIAHIQKLDCSAKLRAAEYIWRAPAFVQTPLRRSLEGHPWFQQNRSGDSTKASK